MVVALILTIKRSWLVVLDFQFELGYFGYSLGYISKYRANFCSIFWSLWLPVSRGHGDNESKQIVDEGVEGLVHEGAPGQVGDRLQLVVDEQLGQHEQEPESVYTVNLRRENTFQAWNARSREAQYS